MTERLLTARELADHLGLSAGTILDRFEAGQLPGYRLFGRKGGPVRFRLSQIEATLEEWRVERAGRARRSVTHAERGTDPRTSIPTVTHATWRRKMSRRNGKHPRRVPARTKGGWRHIESLLHEKNGVEFAEGERVVATIGVPKRYFDPPKLTREAPDA